VQLLGDSFARRLHHSLGHRDALRLETCLCVARVIVATYCFLLIRIVTTEPIYSWRVHGLISIYLMYSFLAFILLRLYGSADLAYCITTFAIDLFFAATITMFSGGPASSCGLLWAFIVLRSASRWGLRETNLIAAASVLLVIAQIVVFHAWPHYFADLSGSAPGIEKAFLRGTPSVLICSLLFGYLIVRGRWLQAQRALVARVTGRGGASCEIETALEALFEEIAPLYLPRQVVLALRKPDGEEIFIWEPSSDPANFRTGAIRNFSQFSRLEAAAFCCPAHSWYLAANSRERRRVPDLLAFDSLGRRVGFVDWEDWYSCLPTDTTPSLMVTTFSFEKPLQGRLILVSPSLPIGVKNALRLLQELVDQVGSLIQNNYQLLDVRARVTDQVRSELSRELHDGVLQSLLSAEMQIEVLRKQRPNAASELDRRLAAVQTLIHQEGLNLRALMEKTRPLKFSPKQLPDFLAELIARFRLETGISARLELGVDSATFPSKTCHEIVRIVQEGLSNIRKHSGARNVLVALREGPHGERKLVITDDGRGFEFRGRLKQKELDASHRGPGVIKERVRLMGAELTVDSSPGNWAQLEINIPDELRG
jgi:signal transduction histidine kinase